MALAYPNLSLAIQPTAGGEMAVWRGVVEPIRSLAGLDAILDDVAHERLVRVVSGEIRHHPECQAVHCHHGWMEPLVYWRIRFELEARYDGGAGDPRCWVRWPPVVKLDKARHVWRDGSICPFLSSDGWDPERDDVVDFMGHVAIWLLKWTLWDQTGVWIGKERGSNAAYHLSAIRLDDPCWCRSGLPYRACHLRSDRIAADAGRTVPAQMK